MTCVPSRSSLFATVLRLRVQRLIRFLPAPGEQSNPYERISKKIPLVLKASRNSFGTAT
jgi:hypothetical protein